MKNELRGHAAAAQELGLSETGFAIYGLINEPKPLTVADPHRPARPRVDESRKELASILEEDLAPQTSIVDWAHKDDIQREMRRRIKRQLRAAAYPADKIESIAESIVDLLKRRGGR